MLKLYWVIYRLKGHRFLGWTLALWIRLLLLAAAAVAFSEGSTPGAVAFVVLLVISFALEQVAGRASYLRFTPSDAATPRPELLAPREKIHLRVSGHFGVEGKWKRFVNLEAYFRTFASREHALMAWVPPSRYLLVGRWPEKDFGLWYIFFRPEHIREITPGTLAVGGVEWHALMIRYWEPEEGKKKAQESIAHLGFEDVESRDRVWADLLWDAVTGREFDANPGGSRGSQDSQAHGGVGGPSPGQNTWSATAPQS